MKVFVKLAKEAVRFAFNALWTHRLRTTLSLLGITIGIFAIISVFTLIDSWEDRIQSSFSSLGSEVIYIQRWPWSFGPGYAWWDYISRPQNTYREYEELKERSQLAKSVCFISGSNGNLIEHREKSLDGIKIMGVTKEFHEVRDLDILLGRYFSESESQRGSNVALLGSSIATSLFDDENPVGKSIKTMGIRYKIIGVTKPEGSSAGFASSDRLVIIPIKSFGKKIDLRRVESDLVIKSKPGIELEELKAEVTGIMRALRRIRPKEKDDFSINQLDMITNRIGEFFGIIALIGGIIGGFSILVGGVGIALIMFVSVRERTNIIGIQMALGAKRAFILFQFLAESIVLSLMGGMLGLLLIAVLIPLVNMAAEDGLGFSIFLSIKNIILGLGISSVIGLVAGLIPAFVASRMDPVEAIRFN